MQQKLITTLLHLLMLLGLSGATTPAKPGLTYLYTVNITGGDYIPVGPGPRGSRTVVPILGGAFNGPKLNGTVLGVGADWSLEDANNPNGTIAIDVRQTFATDDGAYIQVFETGSAQLDGTALVHLSFETGSEKYYWINSVVAVGILRLTSATDLSIEAWQVSATGSSCK